MPDPYMLFALVAAALVMQLTPGPDMMLVMGRGVGQGYRVAQATAIGIASAGFIQLPILAFGVASLVASEPWLFNIIRCLGAAYLIYIGIKFFRKSPLVYSNQANVRTTFGRAVFDGAIANLLNPKMIAFQLAFIPQFVDVTAGPVWSQILILGLVMKACGFTVMSTVAITSGVTGQWIARHPNLVVIQERFVGSLLIALGVRLLFETATEMNTN